MRLGLHLADEKTLTGVGRASGRERSLPFGGESPRLLEWQEKEAAI